MFHLGAGIQWREMDSELFIDEVINAMRRQNYHLVFKSAYVATLLGKEGGIPQDNFGEQYRLGHTCSLLFAKRDSDD